MRCDRSSRTYPSAFPELRWDARVRVRQRQDPIMRILYITNGFPYPLTSGYLRHYHLIQGLAAGHSVTLVSLVGKTFRPEHVEALRPYATQTLTFGDADARPARSWRGARLMRSVVS